jgi:hypothetical protein
MARTATLKLMKSARCIQQDSKDSILQRVQENPTLSTRFIVAEASVGKGKSTAPNELCQRFPTWARTIVRGGANIS